MPGPCSQPGGNGVAGGATGKTAIVRARGTGGEPSFMTPSLARRRKAFDEDKTTYKTEHHRPGSNNHKK